MKVFSVNATSTTPTISLNPETGSLDFTGVSFPEDAISFYKPIFEWIKKYHDFVVSNNPKNITINFKFEYLNSASYIVVRDIAEELIEMTEESDIPLIINWFYVKEDLDMLSMAKEIEYMLDIPINYFHITSN